MTTIQGAGFTKAAVIGRHAIFDGVPHPSDALEFGTRGISLRAVNGHLFP